MLTSKERRVAWTKYYDPLNGNIDEVEWPGHDSKVPPENIEFYDFSETDTATAQSPDRSFFENLGKKIHAIRPLKVINTKMGLLTITENAVADYHFDFWILHTNFPITEEVGNIICEAPGVDSFMPMTRYRCKLGFPKSNLFNITEVKMEIQKRLTEADVNVDDLLNSKSSFTEEVQDTISTKIKELKLRSNYWALYVLPNGNMEIIESDSSGDTFKTKLKIFEESQKLAGGKLFVS